MPMIKVLSWLVMILTASAASTASEADGNGNSQLKMRPQQEANSPETVTENEREAKQLWPFLASYYIQQGQRPLFMAAPTTVQALPHVPPTPVLSASNLFSKYTKSVGTAGNYYFGNTVGNQHPLSAWNHRVKETSTSPLLQDLDQDSSVTPGNNKTSFAEEGQLDSESADMALMESVNSLIETLPATSRQNYFDLNGSGGLDNDIVPLDFPGPNLYGPEITPGDRNFTQSTLESTFVTEISGVGRPPAQPQRPQECCLFVFLDGSAYFFDDFMRKVTGFYRVMYGSVNGRPHYVARNCKNPDEYGTSCTYIWYSGYGWVVGVGKYIGQTKGVVFTREEGNCPTGLSNWRYLDQNLSWQTNGNIYVKCAS